MIDWTATRVEWTKWVAGNLGGDPARQATAVEAAMRSLAELGSPEAAATAARQAVADWDLQGSGLTAPAPEPVDAGVGYRVRSASGHWESPTIAAGPQPAAASLALDRSADTDLQPVAAPRRQFGFQRFEVLIGAGLFLIIGGAIVFVIYNALTGSSAVTHSTATTAPGAVASPSPSPSPSVDPAVAKQYQALADTYNRKSQATDAKISYEETHVTGTTLASTLVQVKADYSAWAQERTEFVTGLNQLQVPDWIKPDLQKVRDDDNQAIAVYTRITQAKSWNEVDDLEPQLCDCATTETADVAKLRKDLGLPPAS